MKKTARILAFRPVEDDTVPVLNIGQVIFYLIPEMTLEKLGTT